MKKIALYMHGGSANHGCEAIVRATCGMLPVKPVLVSTNPQEDLQYSLNEVCEIRQEKSVTANKVIHALLFALKRFFGKKEVYMAYQLKTIRGKNRCDINMMVGGDNYCYPDMVPDLIAANKLLSDKGTTVLWGCSIEPAMLQNPQLIADLRRYQVIIARESITYEALLQAGITNGVYLFPDPAFRLQKKEVLLPQEWTDGGLVGINISPMIIENEMDTGIAEKNYEELIQYIITATPFKVLLIPHVVRGRHDDRKPLGKLYNKFKETGKVFLAEDCECEELKGYIAKCRFFLGARTHSTIAAYSSQVPTIVVGYSVKALGIAKDIFGSYEQYVVPVQELQKDDELVLAFKWLIEREEQIRQRLSDVMPEYIKRAGEAGKIITDLLNEQGEQ